MSIEDFEKQRQFALESILLSLKSGLVVARTSLSREVVSQNKLEVETVVLEDGLTYVAVKKNSKTNLNSAN